MRLRLWLLWFLKSSFVYLKKKQPTFTGWRSCLPCCLSEESQPIITPKPVACILRCVIYLIQHFLHGWYIVAIPDQGVVYFLRAWLRSDREWSPWQCMSSRPPKYCPIIINLFIWEFYTPVLADGFPLESEWREISSSLQDSS